MIKKIFNFVSLVFASNRNRTLTRTDNREVGCFIFILSCICFSIITVIFDINSLDFNQFLFIMFALVYLLPKSSDTSIALYRELPVSNRFAVCCILYAAPVILILYVFAGVIILGAITSLLLLIAYFATRGTFHPFKAIGIYFPHWESIIFLILFIFIVWILFTTISFIKNNSKRKMSYFAAFTGIFGALIGLALYLRQFRMGEFIEFERVFPRAPGAGIILILTGVFAAALIVISYNVGMKLYPNSAPDTKNEIITEK